ncbi:MULTISPECIES: DNA methyltransferase [unclassified Bacillus (in: firmicutes)]|uniref:DNA methyltransferase n=1 Tax=unclassified Bacillus (in: firmicutes) TaxID=185979 RepID=UPI000E35F101|nr:MULTISPECIES: DNA methyltransferase [unclassified Bacillus (in: firmicutes)]AXR16989.1 class I SAM-dependent DNA methyltransferase [Bacillus sp. CR71]AXR22684.1 class I SAM-dependent DNA methyltransferase [Bacillus sp. E25]
MIKESRSELLNKALAFVKEHENDSDEKQQAQMWVRDFLETFGVPYQKIKLGFEWRVNIDGNTKFVDHLLNGTLLIEMKSRDKDLDKAKSQAYRYVMNLSNEDLPKYVMLCNFNRIRLYDLASDDVWEFSVTDLPKYIELFGFLVGKQINVEIPKNPVNEQAAKMMEALHKKLLESKYPRNYADLLMTRIIFCLFADDSGIFQQNQFTNYLMNETREDGSDLVDRLAVLFQVLNTPENERFQADVLKNFPYINGGLFEHPQLTGLPLTTEIRTHLIETSKLDWSRISPVIFGSMFEAAMDDTRRHNLGAHYTSEINIMKVINSLFLEDLKKEFEHLCTLKHGRESRLKEFHDKLSNLKFLDPACGSGNFLIVAYRELRRLEHEVIDEIVQGQMVLDINELIKVEVAQFYGIEIVPYAVSIAKVGLWLMDHLMNVEASELFGRLFLRLPLHAGANVVNADALEVDWQEIIPTDELDYILGNPPFLGSKKMTKENKETLSKIAPKMKGIKNLDFVAGWFIKSARLMNENPNIKSALVSTNSIAQGIQATLLWRELRTLNININFAHQTFVWDNEANVMVVIIGFSMHNSKEKHLYTYPNMKDAPIINGVNSINEYLIDEQFLLIDPNTRTQVSGYPPMTLGSLPLDNQQYIVSEDGKDEIIKKYPEMVSYIHPYFGSQELLEPNKHKRFIIYTKDIPFKLLTKMPDIQKRVENVKEFRLTVAEEDRKLSKTPLVFKRDRYWKQDVLIVPRTSSGARDYVPMGYFDSSVIVSDAAYQVANASLLLFGFLESKMHTVWINLVAGKLKSDFRYSNTLCYNTFPIPNVNDKDQEKIKNLSKQILDTREKYFKEGNSLRDLYGRIMPTDLQLLHERLDKAIEILYRKTAFNSDVERVKHLIKLYQKQVSKKI